MKKTEKKTCRKSWIISIYLFISILSVRLRVAQMGIKLMEKQDSEKYIFSFPLKKGKDTMALN